MADLRRFYGIGLHEVRERLTLQEFAAMVKHLPIESAVARAYDEDWWATPQVRLLSAVEHRLRVLIWQQTKDGQKGKNQPEEVLLTERDRKRDAIRRGVPDVMPIDELRAALERRNGKRRTEVA